MNLTPSHPILLHLLLAIICTLPAAAQFDVPEPRGNDDAKPAVEAAEKAYQANIAKYGKDPDFFVRPGLLADRKEKTVRLWGRATHLAPADPVEFLVIPQGSGKDYEALTEAFCKASDVLAAIEFIGMTPGRGPDPAQFQYWPKGERMIATVEWDQPAAEPGGPAKAVRARAEELVLDGNSVMKQSGFVFTGSYVIKPENGEQKLAADVLDARSIISVYNERVSILDVPRLAPQSMVYGSQKMNKAYRFVPSQPLQVLLTPERKDGTKRVRDYALLAYFDPQIPGQAIKDARFQLRDVSPNAPRVQAAQLTVVQLLALFGKITEEQIDPFVAVSYGESMTVGAAQQMSAFLAENDVEEGIRIDGPPKGQLYYRSYTPREELRDRKNRLGRPWELHVSLKGDAVSGILVLPADGIDDNQGKGDLRFPVSTPAEVAQVLREKSDKWAHSVYIFAPKPMTVGQLLTFIGPAMEVKPAMLVFAAVN